MSFGTGAVKITPAHDPNDYECGKRHNLEFITMLASDGSINENGAPFTGLMRYDARIAVEEALQEKVRTRDAGLFCSTLFESPIASHTVGHDNRDCLKERNQIV